MEQWKHLRQNDAQLPSLLVKASFSKNGYSIRLTDLSRVWAEELSKAEIITRARARNCSIDPGEDTEQYEIFVEKLQSALQQQGNTTLALSTTKNGNLKLYLEAPLPSPLPTFEWEIDLKQMSDRSVEVDLVSPLLQTACLLERHMQMLIAEIQAKDKVIGKITDRLETSGHDLTSVFPGVKITGNKPQREQFARHVRGLGEFDEASLSAKVAADSDGIPVPDESADAILASLPPVNAEKGSHVDWWRKITNGQHIALTKEGLDDGATTRNQGLNHEQSFSGRSKSDLGDENDDFQRQATPPHLRSHSTMPTSNGNVDEPMHDQDSTEDEDDLDGPPSRPKLATRQARQKNTGEPATANMRKSPMPPPSKPTAHAITTHGPFTHEEDTEDTEDDDDDLDGPSQASQKPATSTSKLPSREKSQTPRPPTSSAPSPRKRLGTLGGRARTKSPTPMSTTPIEEEHTSPTPSPAKPKPKSKLGTIGGRKANPQEPSPAPDSEDIETLLPLGKKLGTIGGKYETKSSRVPTASATPERQTTEAAEKHKQDVKAEPAEPEDPVERANAKRDALKRQLEEKAKAPVKKKRKF